MGLKRERKEGRVSKTNPPSNSSRALSVCLRARGLFSFSAVCTVPVKGFCLTGERGSTVEKKGATLESEDSLVLFARRCSSRATSRSIFL